MTPLLVSDISPLDSFCDEERRGRGGEELGILVVGLLAKTIADYYKEMNGSASSSHSVDLVFG